MVEEETKKNIKKKSTWLRFLYMVLFAVIFNIAEFIVVVIVVVQFISKLFTGNIHARLQDLGDSVATFIAEIVRYLTFYTENIPFPFGEWPKATEPRRSQPRQTVAAIEQVDKPNAPPTSTPPSSPPSSPPSAPPTASGPTQS